MKVIDVLNKIANGEITEDTLIEFDNGYKDYCSVKVFFDRYIVDRENLNCEVEIIEEDKKIEKYNTGLDNGNWNEKSVREGILNNNNIEDYLIRVMKDVDNIKFKTFEIIDYLNKENK